MIEFGDQLRTVLVDNLKKDEVHGCQWETEVFSPNCIRAAHNLGCTHSETSN